MTTIEAFGQFRPFTIGFDSIFDKLSEAAVPHNGGINIPYNIIKRSEDSWFIEMAVAGFNKKDINITSEDGMLTIESKSEDKSDKDGEVIHKGISKRYFKRSFTIADDVEIKGAELKDGLLSISMEKIVPEAKKLKTIEIK